MTDRGRERMQTEGGSGEKRRQREGEVERMQAEGERGGVGKLGEE